MSDPLLTDVILSSFAIGNDSFTLTTATNLTDITFNLYNALNELIPNTVVGYPDLTAGSPYTFSGLNNDSTYYFQAVGPSSNSYKYQIVTGPTSSSVTSFPNLAIITDQNSPGLLITQSSFSVSWGGGINSNGDQMTFALKVLYQPNRDTPPQTAIIPLTTETQSQTITTLQTRNKVIDGVPSEITDIVSGGTPYICSIVATNSVGTEFQGNTIEIETFPLDVTNVSITYPYLYLNDDQPLSQEYKFLLFNPDGSPTGISFRLGADPSPTQTNPYRYVVDLRNLNFFYPELPGNTSYIIRLFTRSPRFGYKTLPGVLIQEEPFLTLPSPVTQLIASDITLTGGTVSWMSPGETGVTYSLKLNGDDLGSQTSPYTFTGLTKNTSYNVDVLATNATGSVTSSIALPTLPSLVTNLETSIGSISFDLSWTNTNETDVAYIVQLLDSSGILISNNDTSSTPYTVYGLKGNTTYNYNVISRNANSGAANVLAGTSFLSLPTQASIDSINNITQSDCVVNWTSPEETDVTYTLIASVNSDGSDPVKSITATSSSQALSGLEANTSYYLFITATNTSGSTTSSSFSLLTLPNTPTGLSVSNIGSTTCDVSWTSGDSGVSYQIYRQSSDGTNQVLLNEDASSPQTISGLNPETEYYFIVKASNNSGSVQSSSTSFTTLSNPSITARFPIIQLVINTNQNIQITLKNADGSNNTTEDPANISVSGDDGSNPTVTYTSGGGYGCSVTSATAAVVTYNITSTNFGSTSGSITWNNGGGGGGSGGGGENNGGNEHNNMSGATLHLQQTYTAAVSQTTTVTLMGEQAVAPLVADLTITVPSCNLNSILTLSNAYSADLKDAFGNPTYPSVSGSFTGLLSSASSIDADFNDKTKDKLSAANSSVDTLQGKFKNESWSYGGSAFATTYPLEAVIKVENADIVGGTLSDALSAGIEAPKALELFEQALAAGKVVDSATATTFVSGDSVSVYVTYTLTKTRVFQADSTENSGGYIVADGRTIDISHTVTELATAKTFVYEWKFVHGA